MQCLLLFKKKSTAPSTKTASKSQSKNVATPKKSKGKSVEKSAVPPSFPRKESSVVGSAIPVEKGSTIPAPSGTMYDHTRSKRKAAAS